ncbi:hypothetical protein GGR26_002572 [Lewinella marina]|uniref:Uncharacterized protein n=1 Tax=Neolewinella marina TaxID=438751 RepID=A0A2G0CB45_9BACT|nr:contractile injection system tape measure protein [Neolewinella marina]NJB86795.1 hypothetical protein [Neolewinella marina]PHK97193.1 hypothetical protein CGL56_17280 [Neolewinella marina]
MRKADDHIIERVTLDVVTDRGDYATQQAYTDWLRGSALPAMEAVCDELIPRGERWRMDRLNLDLGWFRTLDLDLPGSRAALLDRLLGALRSSLKEQLAAGKARESQRTGKLPLPALEASDRMAPAATDRPYAAWLHFLSTGHLPWWAGSFPPPEEWAAELTERLITPSAQESRRMLRELMARDRVAVRRLVLDPRHEPAFGALLQRFPPAAAAWAKWVAAGALFDVANLPSLGYPIEKRAWIQSGKGYFWWTVLGNQREDMAAEDVLASALAAVYPEFIKWPPALRNKLFTTLDMPRKADGRPAKKKAGESKGPQRKDSGTRDRPAELEGDFGPTPGTSGKGTGERADQWARDGRDPYKEIIRSTGAADHKAEPRSPDQEPTDRKSPDTPDERRASVRDAVPPKAEAPLGQAGHRNPGASPPPTLQRAATDNDPAREPEATPEPVGTYFYLDHAGVVLAHPFLAPLFTALGYWQEEAFADALARQRAVFLTHYLATGDPAGREEEMQLSKLLCGWPVTGAGVQLTEPLTATECHEADEVLRAVIGHWTALGKASPAGLREGFFAREGRLEKQENVWKITVERKAQDILLGQLPWGISQVLLPWHERIIKVEW